MRATKAVSVDLGFTSEETDLSDNEKDSAIEQDDNVVKPFAELEQIFLHMQNIRWSLKIRQNAGNASNSR